MECPGCIESLTALVDGELSPAERVSLEEHLSHCKSCRQEYESLLLVSRQAAGLPVLEAPPGLWLRIARDLGGGIAVPAQVRTRGWWEWLRALLVRPWVPLTAAVGLLAGLLLIGFLVPTHRLENDFATYIAAREKRASENQLILFDRARFSRYQFERNPFIQPTQLDRNPFRRNPQ